MNKSITQLLAIAVVVLSITAVYAGMRMSAAQTASVNAARDLAVTRADLADLAAWHVTAAAGENGPDASDFNRRIRSAASAVGLVDHLVSVEPGPSVRVRDSDTVRTPIYLRLENVTLRQLIAFLQGMTATDAAARVTGIDLSAPDAAGETGGSEIWAADVTISESAVAPAGSL